MADVSEDNIFKSIILNENYDILIQISTKFVPMSPIDIINSIHGLVPNRLSK